MAGDKESAKKTAATNKRKYGEDYYRKIGSLGGKASMSKASKRGRDGRFVKNGHAN